MGTMICSRCKEPESKCKCTDAKGDWIQTYTNRKFYPTSPSKDDIVIQDIAHALSLQCRFVGHCKKFYSVAEHSVRVSRLCSTENQLWGLLHDAAESYLGDVSRPLKRQSAMSGYRDAETVVMQAICDKFKLPREEPLEVKQADAIMLRAEGELLFSIQIDNWTKNVSTQSLLKVELGWSPEEAEKKFLDAFWAQTGEDHEPSPAEGNPVFKSLLDEIWQQHLSKGKDYGTDEDPLDNIHQVEELGIDPWVYAFCCATEAMRRVRNHLKGRKKLSGDKLSNALLDAASWNLLSEVERRSKEKKEV